MDYVVFGIGFGATILVLGLLLRDLGPRLRYRRGENGVLPADVLVAKIAWDRFCNALGAVLAIGGILFLIATFVCILMRLSDDTGGWVMLGSLALFFILILYWTWAFFDRFGAYGILPERPVAEEPEPELVTVRQPAAVAASDGAGQPDQAARVPDRDTAVPVGPTLAEIEPSGADDDRVEQAGDDVAAAEDGRNLVTAEAEAEEPTDNVGDSQPGDAGTERDTPAPEAPIVTPEERLVQHGDPIDHESAAGDLDTEPGAARPSSLGGRRAHAPSTMESEETGDQSGPEGGEPSVEGATTAPGEDGEERARDETIDDRDSS